MSVKLLQRNGEWTALPDGQSHSNSASGPHGCTVNLAFMTDTKMSFSVHKYDKSLHLRVILWTPQVNLVLIVACEGVSYN